jgi:DnaJ-class molecular chaperone
MGKERGAGHLVTCPECRGRGMIRPEGEWTNETCPTCNGRGEVPSDLLADHPRVSPGRSGNLE